MHKYWQHYKGGRYEFITLALEESTLVPLVVYRSVETGQVWTRPVADFLGEIPRDDSQGFYGPRFRPYYPESEEEF